MVTYKSFFCKSHSTLVPQKVERGKKPLKSFCLCPQRPKFSSTIYCFFPTEMKQHRSLEGLSLFSWAKAGKKCQVLIFFILFFYLTKQYGLPWCSNLPNNFLLTPKFYSRLAELATYKQTLADGTISNAKICAWSPLVLKEVHWILQAEDAQGASNPMPLHAPAQAS